MPHARGPTSRRSKSRTSHCFLESDVSLPSRLGRAGPYGLKPALLHSLILAAAGIQEYPKPTPTACAAFAPPSVRRANARRGCDGARLAWPGATMPIWTRRNGLSCAARSPGRVIVSARAPGGGRCEPWQYHALPCGAWHGTSSPSRAAAASRRSAGLSKARSQSPVSCCWLHASLDECGAFPRAQTRRPASMAPCLGAHRGALVRLWLFLA